MSRVSVPRFDTGHYVYILRCADGTLYTGYARDPKARERLHNNGRGARYTSGRRPVKVIYAESCASLSDALKREHEIKRWPRAQKHALIRQKRRRRSSPKQGGD